jgi:exosortase/archaeosortase family protein
MKIRLTKTITPLIWRGIVFLCLFVAISGMFGPRIISSTILFRDGFGVYGGIGKAMIFGMIAFVLLVHRAQSQVTLRPWRLVLLIWFGIAAILHMAAWIGVTHLLNGQRTLYNLLLAHGGLLAGLGCLIVGCVGAKNIRSIWYTCHREIITATMLAGIFYLFLLGVYALWQPLATVVLHSVNSLLGVSGIHATIIPPNTLLLDKFGITVAEYCSGIESIALFTSLYAIVGILDWCRLQKQRYFIVFPIALIILCGLNILRVYGLIMAGYYINPQIAFSLFHTYAGMMFFILYSAAFWAVSYKHLLNNSEKSAALHEV